MGLLIFLKLAISLLGLAVPGYALARALNLQRSWAAAFPLSALLLVEFVILFSVVNVPLTFGAMAIGLTVSTGLSILLVRWRGTLLPSVPVELDSGNLPIWLVTCCLGVTFTILAAFMFRTTLFPLSGYDTFFRWEALARHMLLQKSLHYYPPVSAEDYAIYLVPDGIPPLVATVYWWLYAAIGKPVPQVTSVSAVLQFGSALALIFYATRQVFGLRAAYCSLLAFSTSTLLIQGFAIGQESGFTALSVAGQICFAFAAVRNPRMSTVVAAGLFAALGALTRDYGPVLALAGFMVLALHHRTRRLLPAFVITVVIFSAPWYLRNWALTGNPLYPHALPGGFPVNAVFLALHQTYNEIFSICRYDLSQWLNLLGLLLAGAPLVILIGIPYGIARWRVSGPLLITSGVIMLLWLLSIGETPGGVEYSMRVLTPMLTLFSVLAGGGVACLAGEERSAAVFLRPVFLVVAGGCSLYALACSLLHPFPPFSHISAVFSTNNGFPEFCLPKKELAAKLQASKLPPTGVLTDSAYLATILQRETRFRPVMVWSPEVSFVFDPLIKPQELRTRLLEKNIRVVSLANNQANNRYLTRFPLYQEFSRKTAPDGVELVAAEGGEALFQLMPDR